jgi:methionine-rich copper-binding protein CopC
MTTKIVRLRAGILASVATTMAFLTAQANAHAKVESTTPVANATVSSPQSIQVRFNEAIETKLSSLKLTTSDGGAVPVKSINDARNPATLSIMPNTALKPGVYTVAWSAVTDDGHKTHGVFTFTVR